MGRLTLVSRYPYFSAYIWGVICSGIVRFWLQPSTSRAYALGYWISEFGCALLAYGVTWEIYRHTLAPYQGLRRVARAVVGLLFALIAAKAAAELWTNPMGLRSTTVELERNVRVVQALLLVAIVGMVVHYSVPMGRNVCSMLVGYGLYVAVRAVLLALLSWQGVVFQPWVSMLLQSAWVLALVIWCVGMWSASPNPVAHPQVECAYESVSGYTVRAMGQLREHLTHSWRA
ncbi:MAG: hypothetical protein JO323_00405 [Acidobacteriia bacterium]|nr:hypothetical protein [Terriglobia bacterium]